MATILPGRMPVPEAAGDAGRAVALLVGASAVAFVTWLQIESPAGAL